MRDTVTSRALRPWHWAGLVLSVALLGLVPVGSANADTAYNPGNGTFNGSRIYISVACHDGNDGTPGGPCITNTGCFGYSENAASAKIADLATRGDKAGTNFLERGYQVVIGNGTVGENIANSNRRATNVHLPIHTNAKAFDCDAQAASYGGTWGLYRSNRQRGCATRLSNLVGEASPGSNDIISERTGLGELNNVDAPTCYLEAEFHTWNRGANFNDTSGPWSFRIAAAVDDFLGYP